MKKITVERIDFIKKKIGKIKRTDEGYLSGEAAIAKVGIMTYYLKDGKTRRELVTEDTLFNQDSMSTLRMKPITNQHPKTVLIDSKTVKQEKVGFTGENVKRDGDFLVTPMVITDSDAIESVDGGTQELSPGYRCIVSLESGEFNGEKYDAIQLSRKYNHVAICDKARGGSDLKLNLDAVHCDGFDIEIDTNEDNKNSTKKEHKNMFKITINNIDYEVNNQEVVNEFEKLKSQVTSLKGDADKEKGKISKLQADLDTKTDKYEEISKKLPEMIRDGIKTRLELERVANDVLDKADLEKIDEVSNIDLKKKIIVKQFPKAQLDEKDETYLNARLDAIIEDLEDEKKKKTPINKARGDNFSRRYDNSHNYDENKSDGDKAREKMVNDLNDAWKKDPNEAYKKQA